MQTARLGHVPISTSSRVMHSTNFLRLFVRMECSRISFSEPPGGDSARDLLEDPDWRSRRCNGSKRWMRCQ